VRGRSNRTKFDDKTCLAGVPGFGPSTASQHKNGQQLCARAVRSTFSAQQTHSILDVGNCKTQDVLHDNNM
jgi:hypothetical protein